MIVTAAKGRQVWNQVTALPQPGHAGSAGSVSALSEGAHILPGQSHGPSPRRPVAGQEVTSLPLRCVLTCRA